MTTEQNKALVKRAWEEVFNQKKLAVIDELFHSDYIYHGPQGYEFRGTESLKQLLSHYLEAFPDFHIEIGDLIAEGDKVVSRVISRGNTQR